MTKIHDTIIIEFFITIHFISIDCSHSTLVIRNSHPTIISINVQNIFILKSHPQKYMPCDRLCMNTMWLNVIPSIRRIFPFHAYAAWISNSCCSLFTNSARKLNILKYQKLLLYSFNEFTNDIMLKIVAIFVFRVHAFIMSNLLGTWYVMGMWCEFFYLLFAWECN